MHVQRKSRHHVVALLTPAERQGQRRCDTAFLQMVANLPRRPYPRHLFDNVARSNGYPHPGARLVFACRMAARAGATRAAVEHYLDQVRADALSAFAEEQLRADTAALAKESGEAITAAVEALERPSEGAIDRACREVRDMVNAGTAWIDRAMRRQPEPRRIA